MSERQSKIFRAQIAHKIKRFDDVMREMFPVLVRDPEPTLEECKLYFSAADELLQVKSAAWKGLVEREVHGDYEGEKKKIIIELQTEIEKEIKEICEDVLSLLVLLLIPRANANDAKEFFEMEKTKHEGYFRELHHNSMRRLWE